MAKTTKSTAKTAPKAKAKSRKASPAAKTAPAAPATAPAAKTTDDAAKAREAVKRGGNVLGIFTGATYFDATHKGKALRGVVQSGRHRWAAGGVLSAVSRARRLRSCL